MTTSIYERVDKWICEGIPKEGLSDSERGEIIESAVSSYLAEHVGRTEHNLKALDDKSLVSVHYRAMVERSR